MFQPQFQIDPEILEALRAAFQRYLLSQPVSATFVDHHAESSRVIASGPCQAHAFSVDPGNPEANQDSLIVGTCEGCTENTFGLGPIQFGGENTTGTATGAFSFFYAVPADRLLQATYSFTTTERLRGRARIETLSTLNGPFTTTAERDFSASVDIRRVVRVLDGDQTVLSIDDNIGSFSSQGNADDDNFIGESQNINVDISSPAFVTSQFAVSGTNDLIIQFHYIFSARAKGSLNQVIFTGPNGQGSFSVRNRGVVITADL
jgi:hypothetical protein